MELQPAAAGAVMAFRTRCGNDERGRERRRERGRQCWRERGCEPAWVNTREDLG